MKRKDFFQLIRPLTPKLYKFAYAMIPDDLQAEQLVIDGLNAFLLNEQKEVVGREIDLEDKKDLQVLGRRYFKGILAHISVIGIKRAAQLSSRSVAIPEGHKAFFALEPKIRATTYLRYMAQLTVDEIEDVLQIPRFEVIEKLHNGRFLLLNDLNKGMFL